jgi:hypothetical protein
MKHIEKLIVLVLILVFILITGIQNYVSSFYNEGEGFEWDTIAKTTKDLPIIFADCDFHHSGYNSGGCEQNIILYGDGNDNSLNCSGSGLGERKDLYPDNFKLLYYSFSENKFFAGSIKLNYDLIQSIGAKMRMAVEKEKNLTQSINFKATIYPKGKVVISMESYIDTSVGEIIIARFQAHPEVHDWSVFKNEDYTGDKITGISKSNSVEIQRTLLMERYNWQLEVLLPKGHKVQRLNVDVYGSKSLDMDTIKNTTIPTYSNFGYMPQALSLSWQRMDTIEFLARFMFDEKEIIHAFHDIDVPNGKQPIKIQIIAKNDTTALQAKLHCGNKNLVLKNLDKEKVYADKMYH